MTLHETPWPEPSAHQEVRIVNDDPICQAGFCFCGECDETDPRVPYKAGAWTPGDPLYRKGATCVVRRMIDIPNDEIMIESIAYAGARWCLNCGVSWAQRRYQDDERGRPRKIVVDGPPNCWNCGRFGHVNNR